MNPVLLAMLKALGLAETATEAEATTAIAALKAKADNVENLTTQIATLNVTCAGKTVQTAPLYAASTVEQGDLVHRAGDAIKHLLLGWLP